MANENMDKLPPEMQQRIQDIIAKAQANPVAAQQAAPQQTAPPAAPITKPPSLMDHTIALRHEVAAVRQELAAVQAQLNAVAQVTDAVGNAVGQLYSMFHEQSTPTTYSQEFQAAPPAQVDDY